MATTLSLITGYTENHKDELLVKAALDARTIKYVEIMPNVKYKDVLNYLDSAINFQDGSQCGFNPDGSDTFSEKDIETKAIKVEKSWCWKDFEKSAFNYQLLWEAGREKMPWEEKITESNLAAIQEELESVLWNGDSGLSIDGYIELISETESASTIAVSAVTSANTIVEKVDAVVAAVPVAALKKGVNVFMSYTNLRNYILAGNATCCSNRPIQDAALEEVAYVGDSRVMLVAVNGIGDDMIVAASKDALVYATDVENAENSYRVWFNEETEMFNFRCLFRAGTALKFPAEIAYYKEA